MNKRAFLKIITARTTNGKIITSFLSLRCLRWFKIFVLMCRCQSCIVYFAEGSETHQDVRVEAVVVAEVKSANSACLWSGQS